jgi:hypothetical protein
VLSPRRIVLASVAIGALAAPNAAHATGCGANPSGQPCREPPAQPPGTADGTPSLPDQSFTPITGPVNRFFHEGH